MEEKRISFTGYDIVDVVKMNNEAILPMLTFWLSNRCNLVCNYCSTEAGKLPDVGELTLDEIKKLILDCKKMGAKYICINGKGEPLMDRNSLEIIDFIADNNFTLTLVTNATLISKKVAKFLFDRSVCLEVKLHGLDEKIHDKLVGVPGAHNKTMTGIYNLLDSGYGNVKEKDGQIETELTIAALLARPAVGGIPELMKFCKSNNIFIRLDDLIPCGRAFDYSVVEELAVTNDQKSWLCEQYKDIMGYPHDGIENWQCPQRIGLFVDNIGNVRVDEIGNSCDIHSTLHFANIRENTIEGVWKRLLMQRMACGNRFISPDFRSDEIIATCPKMREAQKKWEQEHNIRIWNNKEQ